MISVIKRFVAGTIILIFCQTAYPQMYSSILCKDPQFTCYTVKRSDTWETLFTNSQTRDLVMKLNRVNIRLYKGMKIAIPTNDDRNIMDYSPFPKQITAPNEKVIFVSLKFLAWGAYNSEGQLENWGPASGGRGYCPDTGHACHTATGKFAIYRKEGAECVSTKFPVGRGGAPMPYCMFFKGGFALHGSPFEVPGYNASHGCVRLFVNDAEWLNENFLADDKNVTVIIRGQT